MWIFTQFGFFSIVAHREKLDTLLIRGRSHKDLQAFADRIGNVKVVTMNLADYRYRFEAPKARVAEVLSAELNELSYDNFKDRVAETQGYERAGVYGGVWAHLHRHLS
jgi:hypothetical protein